MKDSEFIKEKAGVPEASYLSRCNCYRSFQECLLSLGHPASQPAFILHNS
jgi:hypothetical protein